MTWGDAFPSLLAAIAWLVGPGLIVTAPFRLGALARAAISGLVGVCLVVGAATLFGAFGLSFAWWQVGAVTAIGLALALAVRPAMPRLEPRPDRRLLLTIGLWMLSVLAAATVTFFRVPTPDRISQTREAIFQLSSTSAVLDGHSASPFALGELHSTAGAFVYESSAWQSFAALVVQTTGLPIAAAFNVLWVALVAAVWLPGICWFTRTLVPTWSAAVVAMPLGVSFGWFPYALLTWGTHYSATFAYALMPAAAALAVLATRAVLGDRGRRSRPMRWTAAAVGAALAGGAIVAAEPKALASLFVVVAPFAVWRLIVVVRNARDQGPERQRHARIAAMVAAASGLVLVSFGLWYGHEAIEPTAQLDYPSMRVNQTAFESLTQVLMTQSLLGVTGIVTIVAPLLALAVIGGVFMALRRPSNRWFVASYVLFAALYVLAAGSYGVVARTLTGPWSDDPFLVAAALPLLAVPLAAVGVVTLGRVIFPKRRAISAAAAIALSFVIAVASTGTLAESGVSESAGSVFRLPAADSEFAVVSAAQIQFMQGDVRSRVPAGQRVLGDPWDGSALTGVYAGREPVFPDVAGEWDEARLTLAQRLPMIGEEPEVCEALDALRVRYVLYNPHQFAGGDPQGSVFSGIRAAVDAGLFTLVADDDDSRLYRIEQCGPLA
ncbi:DUF6541 family protein [Microbacterium halophytorum]|uniref:DUF6541 family protein n=1 Tax=Microbacterium halophytorum TaxID=2067568 RepID=UPI000CFB9CFE|nr:DUF6541 family protein [Microbacterium halophytorum]